MSLIYDQNQSVITGFDGYKLIAAFDSTLVTGRCRDREHRVVAGLYGPMQRVIPAGKLQTVRQQTQNNSHL